MLNHTHTHTHTHTYIYMVLAITSMPGSKFNNPFTGCAI